VKAKAQRKLAERNAIITSVDEEHRETSRNGKTLLTIAGQNGNKALPAAFSWVPQPPNKDSLPDTIARAMQL